MAKDERILEQTRGKFRLSGKVVGVERDNFYGNGIVSKGASEGKEYRSIRFGVQTSPNQTVYVEMFGMEPTKVYILENNNRDEKGKAKGRSVSYDEYLDKRDAWEEDGTITIESTVSLVDSGKDAEKSHHTKFDNILLINDKLENGMDVYITGNISHSVYTGRDGNAVKQTRYEIQDLSLANREIDFDSPKFKEYAMFTEEFVLTDSELFKEDEKLVLYGKVINYSEETFDVEYEVSYARNHCGEDLSLTGEEAEKNKKEVDSLVATRKAMIKAFKSLPFGTLLKCDGEIVNKVLVEEVEDEGDGDALLNAMRGSSKKQIRSYAKSAMITGTHSYEAKKYSEDDFINALDKNSLVKEEKVDDTLSALKGNTDSSNDSFDDFDISDDDLPF